MNETIKTCIRLAVEFILMLNGFLAGKGITYFNNVTAETLYFVISIVLAVIVFFYTAWKNHNFTEAAQNAHSFMKAIKNGEVMFKESDETTIKIHTGDSAGVIGEEPSEEDTTKKPSEEDTRTSFWI